MYSIINFDQVANPEQSPVLSYNNTKPFNNYNPNSNHKLGKEAKNIIAETKNKFLETFPYYKYCYFLSGGGTSANKRSILGLITYKPKRIDKELYLDKIIISSIEHKSINEVILDELVNRGYTVIKIPVNTNGIINLDILQETIEKFNGTIALVSVMNVNNETGIIQPIEKIYNIIKNINNDIIFHSDICQGLGVLYNQHSNYPDVISFSIYKLGGPHIGVVLSNYELNDEYMGTEDTLNIELSGNVLHDYICRLKNKEENAKLIDIKNQIKKLIINQAKQLNIEIIDLSTNDSVSFIQSFLFPQEYEAKTIQGLLSDEGICIGTGSACSTQSNKGSHVIEAMGYISQTYSLIRFSYNQTVSYTIDNVMVKLYDILTNLKSVLNKDSNCPIIKHNNNIVSIKDEIDVKKEYTRLNLPLDIELKEPEYNYIKLAVGELYLKGNNKQIYFNKLVNNIITGLNIIKKDILTKENIIIIRNTKNHHVSEFCGIFGVSKISKCDIIKRTNDDLKILTGLVCCIVNNYLDKNAVCLYRLTVDYNRIGKFHELSSNKLTVELGQYIRDRFGDKVNVNLKNYNVNVIINIYSDIFIISTEENVFKGVGGLPLGTSGTGVCIIDNIDVRRLVVSGHMSMTRGSNIEFIHADNFTDSDIISHDYVIIEPSKHNDNSIYRNLNILEKKYNKPFITNTNLLSDVEIQEYILKFNLQSNINNCIKSNVNIIEKLSINGNETKNVLMLLSGGIDSPVASYLLIKNNYNVDYIHFTTDIDKIDNIMDIRKILNNNGKLNSKLYVIKFKELQQEIVRTCEESYRTIMYKVFMILIANKIGKSKYDAIGTGNSLGQVASQTIENIRSTNLVSELPIICPLFGYNKDDIIDISRSIGTYKPSTCDGTNDCCVMYMPKHPIIRSNYNIILKNISKIDCKFIDNLNISEYH